MQRDAADDCPCEDADVVRRRERMNRIVDDAENEIVQAFRDAGRRHDFRVRRNGEVQRCRERERVRDGDERREERRKDVELHDWLHRRARVRILLRHRVHDEHEDEDRRDAFQRFDEQIAEDRHGRHGLRHRDREQDAEHEADGDELDQRRLLVLPANFLEHKNNS